MKEKEIKHVVEDYFKTIGKVLPSIIKESAKDDIHDFRVEVKKLRAFLRLLNGGEETDHSLIPKLLKSFYGYTGIVRDLQLQRHYIFSYITNYKIEEPAEYLAILNDEEKYWMQNAKALMADKDFSEAKEKILKQIPHKLEKSAIKKFVENKLDELEQQLKNLKDDAAIHTIRKILKDILYAWDYIKDVAQLPEIISKQDDVKLLTKQLGDYIDLCMQLEFLQPEYLDNIKKEDEKVEIEKIKDEVGHEKKLMLQQLNYSFDELRQQLNKK